MTTRSQKSRTPPANQPPLLDLSPQILCRRNTNPDFYGLIGPWLSRREMVKATGQPFWDDDDKTWFVDMMEGRPVGCVALRGADVCSLWVEPEARRRGRARRLIQRTVEYAQGPTRATVTAAAVGAFLHAGFHRSSERGRYAIMRHPGP